MELEKYDAVIIGARVAGSILTALLGDAGYRVLLVEKGAFPSPTPSTHYFRGGGMVSVLHDLGILEQVLDTGAPKLVQQYLYMGGASEPIIQPPQNPGKMGYSLSVRRETLDSILVQRACQCPSVELAVKTRFTGLIHEGGRVVGARLATADSEKKVLAKIVIGADGRYSTVAKAVQAVSELENPPSRAIFYRYVRNFHGVNGPADGSEFSFFDDEVAYVFPSDSGLTCIALSVNLSEYHRIKEAPTERFLDRILTHKGISDRYQAAIPEGKVLGCGPEPQFVRVPFGEGWALVGDASIHQDPWSGLGMDMASMHSTLLAESLLHWFSHPLSEKEALHSYHQRRNAHALDSYRQTVHLAKDLRQMFKH